MQRPNNIKYRSNGPTTSNTAATAQQHQIPQQRPNNIKYRSNGPTTPNTAATAQHQKPQ
jgi:hypothetical protein